MANAKSYSNIKGEWFVIAGAVLIVISLILDSLWGIKKPEDITLGNLQDFFAQQRTWQYRLSKTIGNAGLAIFTISSIIIGIRSFREKGINLKAVSFTLCGALICLYHFSVIYVNYGIGKMPVELGVLDLKIKMESRLNQGSLPLKEKAFLSKSYAQLYYVEEGRKIDYITENGDMKIYEPTATDLKMRDNEVVVIALADVAKKNLNFAIPYWIGISVISLFLGIFSPIRTKLTNG